MSNEPFTRRSEYAEPPADAAPPILRTLGEHGGLLMAYGLVSLGLGITLAVWPGETLKVVAVLIGIQFLLTGVVRLVGAIAGARLDTAVRTLLSVTGALAVVVGLLALRDPLQTLLALTLMLGVWWVATGIIDIVGAVVSPPSGRCFWDLLAGLVSMLAGLVLLGDPHLSLTVLVLVTWIWLVLTGIVSITAALRFRGHQPRGTGPVSGSPTAL